MGKNSSEVLVVVLALSCLLWCCKGTQEYSFMACDEIYVVHEGETLQTISAKCGDPFIVEENPHINDPDDVFPGLVIKITPFRHIINAFLT